MLCKNFVLVFNYVDVFLVCVILFEMLLFDVMEKELCCMMGVMVLCEDWKFD